MKVRVVYRHPSPLDATPSSPYQLLWLLKHIQFLGIWKEWFVGGFRKLECVWKICAHKVTFFLELN